MEQNLATTQSNFKSSIDLNGLFQKYFTVESGVFLGVFLFLILIAQLGGKKAKISTGRLTGTAEKFAATSLALKQIKERKHNRVTFWCGTPQYWWRGNQLNGLISNSLAKLQTIFGNSPTVWLPHAERSSLVLGAPGGGKTFGSIDRMIESCLKQGFPLIVYAKKEEQMRFVAPLAARYGYDVRVFAPGEPYSEVINPLDFMANSEDQVSAGQIAEVINGNAGSGGNKNKGNDFFDKAANLFAKALIQLAKYAQEKGHPDCADLATVYCLQSVDKFIDKLDFAIKNGLIPLWIAASFRQYLSAKGSEKTIASIETTTVGIFSGFIQKSLLPSFIGKSTINTRLKGKQILIFKLDDGNRDVVSPLLAAGLHMSIVNNLATPRQDPLGIFIDELPSLYLKSLPQWINEYRSNGACFVLGVQSIKQLADAYGDNLAQAIISACNTKILYNPGNYETAKEFSDIYGLKDVLVKNRSITTNRKEGRNVTWTDSLQSMPLFTADQIMRLPQGRCIITNPGYISGAEGSVPYLLKIPIPAEDIKRIQECEDLWSKVKAKLIKRAQKNFYRNLDEAINVRERVAELLLFPSDSDRQASTEIVSPPEQLTDY
jgi:type IV secretory pathway TraG/TraD family ATPase VirD4